MLVRQSKHTFIRVFNNSIGYIMSQLTKADRVYNDTGSDFLSSISRIPQNIDEIIDRLALLYIGVNKTELRNDFLEFIYELEKYKFVVIGNTKQELDKNEISFSYRSEDPKILGYDFMQGNLHDNVLSTEKYLYGVFQTKPQLMDIQIEIVSGCNERCIHCYIPNSKKNKNEVISLAKVKEIINEFVLMGGLHITLTGGEAFLHKDIDKILFYCVEKDLSITILSNLVLLTDEHIRLLKQINPNGIQVSLYSMDEEIHDSITKVKGSHKKTKLSIEKCVAANIQIQISCPVMKANKDSYKDVLGWAYKLKVKAQTDFIMMAQSDFNKQNLANRISLEETEKLIQEIIVYDKDYMEIVRTNQSKYENIDEFKDQPICGVGMSTICLSSNGEYYPCAGWQSCLLGNAYNMSLQEVWKNSEKIKYLRTITNASFPRCLKCEARNYCSVCLVRNFNENNGNMFEINKHFCDVAFLNKRIVENILVNGNEN